MNVTKTALAAVHCASGDKSRFNLNVLRFEKDGSIIGVDGHILARVIPDNPEGAAPREGFSLDLAAIKSLLAAVKKKGSVAILDVGETSDKDHAEFAGPDRRELHPKMTDGEFPNWRQVHKPVENPALTIGVGVAMLEKLVKSLKQFDVEYCRVTLGEDPLSPFRVEAENSHGEKIEFTAMPSRV